MPKKTTLPKLELELLPGDFRQLRGRVFLALGILLTLAVAGHYVQTNQAIAVIEAEVERSITPDMSDYTSNSAKIEETRIVRASMEHLTLPWGSLFSALEKVDVQKVNLVSLVPDAQKNTVKIIAETEDVYEMLGYIRGLAAQPRLKDVLLTKYEIRRDDTNQSVRFTLTAVWKAMP